MQKNTWFVSHQPTLNQTITGSLVAGSCWFIATPAKGLKEDPDTEKATRTLTRSTYSKWLMHQPASHLFSTLVLYDGQNRVNGRWSESPLKKMLRETRCYCMLRKKKKTESPWSSDNTRPANPSSLLQQEWINRTINATLWKGSQCSQQLCNHPLKRGNTVSL